MSLLTIHYADGRTVPVPITKDAMVIGRDATCDIPLEDAITSRQHARFERDSAGNYWIQDLESKNGTTVNDRGVARSQLRAGDRIGIGGCFLTLANEASPSTPQLSDAPVTGEAPTTRAWDTSQRIVLPQQRLEKLYELNERLTGRFDRKDLLEEVLRISVELLRFERAGIAVWRGPPHTPDWVAWRNVSTDKSGEFQISRSLVERALHNAERILVRDTSMEMADPTASIISNNIQSAMCVPMIVHDRVQGVMYGDRVTSTGGYTHEDTDFFAALGRLGAMGLANAQLAEEMKHRQEMELQIEWARQIQNGLSPCEPLIRPGLQIAALNDPGQHVSGDYYDYFVRPDGRIVIVMADVMGKGIPASLLMANLQAGVRVTLDTEDDLARGVGELNRLICNNVREARFITALFGVLDPESGELTFANAGHWPPYRLGSSGEVTALELESALPLGIEPDCRYVAAGFELSDRPTTLFLFTDGVPEAENDSDGQLGFDRMVEMLRNNAGRAPDDLLRRVRTSVNQFTRNHPQSDDITMMAIRLE